jgi:hypothetical protein
MEETMKKITIVCVMLLAMFGAAFAQSDPAPDASQKYTMDDVWNVLNTAFDKYEWAQQVAADKSPSPRPAGISIHRYGFQQGADDLGKTLSGEIMYITIYRGGYRYYMRYEFYPKKESGAIRTQDLKAATYRLLAGLPTADMKEMGYDPATTGTAPAQPSDAGGTAGQ